MHWRNPVVNPQRRNLRIAFRYSDYKLPEFGNNLLWLVAFACIRLNILDWQTGKNDHAQPTATSPG